MLNDRQEHILEQLRMSGHVEVDELASTFDVTTQTIRRDLGNLCDLGLAARVHGGARRIVSTSTVAYEDRRRADVQEKLAIAQKTAGLIPDGCSVAINIGTTTEQVAQALSLHRNLTVISNNINVIHILQNTRVRSLIIVGGEVRLSDGAIVGSDAVDAIRNFKVDYAVIGASALDMDGSVLDFDQREVAVARAILANARTRILVCNRSKFGVSAPHRICDLHQLDFVVTDNVPPRPFTAAARTASTRIITTDERRLEAM